MRGGAGAAAVVEICAMAILILSFTWLWNGAFRGDFLVCVAIYLAIGIRSHRRCGESAREIGFRLDNIGELSGGGSGNRDLDRKSGNPVADQVPEDLNGELVGLSNAIPGRQRERRRAASQCVFVLRLHRRGGALVARQLHVFGVLEFHLLDLGIFANVDQLAFECTAHKHHPS